MLNNNQKKINICNIPPIITPKQLKLQFPLSYVDQNAIKCSQDVIINIIKRRDPRLLIVCGPCSIHDIHSTLEYANKLKSLSIKLEDQLYIVMRVYLEKPRTVVGWKGLINDPYMNNSCDIESGLKIARNLLLELTKIGLPLATEILNPNIPQYIGDLFSWVAIGARTTESQIHREMASGLSAVIGFKNSTSGNICNAINAIQASSISHKYIGINQLGQACLIHTQGNSNAHVILRGGVKPNYDPEHIKYCEKKIMETKLPITLMIDCSHGNSNKDYKLQVNVAKSVLNQIKYGNCSIIGLMLESHVHSGNQNLDLISSSTTSSIQYGISVTDSCIDWNTTEQLLCCMHKELKSFLVNRFM